MEPVFNIAFGVFLANEIKIVSIGEEEVAKNLAKLDSWEIVADYSAPILKTKIESKNRFFEVKKNKYKKRKEIKGNVNTKR